VVDVCGARIEGGLAGVSPDALQMPWHPRSGGNCGSWATHEKRRWIWVLKRPLTFRLQPESEGSLPADGPRPPASLWTRSGLPRDFGGTYLGTYWERSNFGKAVAYVLSHWTGLTRLLEDAAVPLDYNPAERALRGLVVGRKNHYGSRSQRGADVCFDGEGGPEPVQCSCDLAKARYARRLPESPMAVMSE
jgi:Transposase IS66 family